MNTALDLWGSGCGQCSDPAHCGDIMAERGDSWATDACLPEHWRDVRDWSIEKRQSHRVRLFFPHSGLRVLSSCFLGTEWIQSDCKLFSASSVDTKSFRRCAANSVHKDQVLIRRSSDARSPLLISKPQIMCTITLWCLTVHATCGSFWGYRS